jgi:hypothetical protein
LLAHLTKNLTKLEHQDLKLPIDPKTSALTEDGKKPEEAYEED